MRTTNQFQFGATGKDPKEMIRTCMEEMLASVPDGVTDIQISLNLDIREWDGYHGKGIRIFDRPDETSTISFSIGVTPSEGYKI